MIGRVLLGLLLCGQAWAAVELSTPVGPRGAIYRWAQPADCGEYVIRIAGEVVREGTTRGAGSTINQSVTVPVGQPLELATVEACGRELDDVSWGPWERRYNRVAVRDPAPEPVAVASIVQERAAEVSGGTISFSSSVTAGNDLLLLIAYYPSASGNQVTAVSDNQSNTWAQDFDSGLLSSGAFAFRDTRFYAYRATGVAAGSTTITVTADAFSFAIYAYLAEVDEAVSLEDSASATFDSFPGITAYSESLTSATAAWLMLGGISSPDGITATAGDGETVFQPINAFGQSQVFASQEIASFGTDTVDIDLSVARRCATFAVAYAPAASGATELTVEDAVHGHVADAPVLAQSSTLAPNDALHGHSADAVDLTQASILSPGDALHAHSADGVELVQAASLTVEESVHAHIADGVALLQDSILAVSNATHAHTADVADLLQSSVLAAGSSQHAHSTGGVDLVTAGSLAPQGALHGHSADAPALVQASALSPQDALHGHLADGVELTASQLLTAADALHAHSASAVELGLGAVLGVQDALHAHSADELALTQASVLLVNSAAHGHTADTVNLSQSIVLAPADSLHGHAADGVVLTQAALLAIQDALHAHFADAAAALQGSVLVVSDSLHAHLVRNIVLPGTVFAADRLMVVRGTNRLMIVAPTDRLMVVRN